MFRHQYQLVKLLLLLFFYPDVTLIGVCLTQHTFMFTLTAVCAEERTADSLDNTLGEQTLDETLNASEVRGHGKCPRNN